MFGFFTPHNLRGPWRLYEKCSTEKFNWNIKSCTARGAHCDSVPHQQSHSGLGGLWRPPTSPLIERHTVDSWPGLVVGCIFYCTGNYLIIFWQLEAGESEMWLHSTVILLLITDNTLRVVQYLYLPTSQQHTFSPASSVPVQRWGLPTGASDLETSIWRWPSGTGLCSKYLWPVVTILPPQNCLRWLPGNCHLPADEWPVQIVTSAVNNCQSWVIFMVNSRCSILYGYNCEN